MRFHANRRPGLGEEEDKEEEGEVTLTEMDINHIPLEMREYRVASTEARVTLASAKPLLYMFCAKLPADRSASLISVKELGFGIKFQDSYAKQPCVQWSAEQQDLQRKPNAARLFKGLLSTQGCLAKHWR